MWMRSAGPWCSLIPGSGIQMSDPGLTRLIAPEAIMAGGGFKISWRPFFRRSGQCWMDPLTGIIHESP